MTAAMCHDTDQTQQILNHAVSRNSIVGCISQSGAGELAYLGQLNSARFCSRTTGSRLCTTLSVLDPLVSFRQQTQILDFHDYDKPILEAIVLRFWQLATTIVEAAVSVLYKES